MSLCLDQEGNLKGIQFQLKALRTTRTLNLNPLGDMGSQSGDSCFQFQMQGPIKALKLSQTPLERGVDALTLTVNGKERTFGDHNDKSFKQEFVLESTPLIGLYGYQNNGQIKQLGFYTLRTECIDT